jgi:hypothetical protein
MRDDERTMLEGLAESWFESSLEGWLTRFLPSASSGFFEFGNLNASNTLLLNINNNNIAKVSFKPVLLFRISMFLNIPDKDPSVRRTEPDPALDPSIINQK